MLYWIICRTYSIDANFNGTVFEIMWNCYGVKINNYGSELTLFLSFGNVFKFIWTF